MILAWIDRRRLPPVLACSLLAACAIQHDIGSACEEGLCERAMLASSLPCLLTTSSEFVEPMGDVARDRCVNAPEVELTSGMAPCRAFVSYPAGRDACEALGLAEHDDGSEVTSPECELPQLEPSLRDSAEVDRTLGWHFEDSLLPSDACWNVATFRLHLTSATEMPSSIRFRCTTALAHFSDVEPVLRRGELPVNVTPASCGGLPPLPMQTPDDTGTFCQSRVTPQDGFRFASTYVEARTDQCSSGVCLIDGPAAAMVYPCGDPEACGAELDFDDASYCSCRCDAKGDDSRAPCECPAGFTCKDVLDGELPDSLAGGYCVRAP